MLKDSYKSMSPLISPFDKVFVQKTKTYKTNDIAVLKKGRILIAHRVVYVSPDKNYVITRGDANRLSDGLVNIKTLLGKIEKVRRNKETVYFKHLYLSHSSLVLKELREISNKFDKEKVSYLILKGLITHLAYLNAPPKRFYFDTDFLVDPRDEQKALKILKNLRFRKIPATLLGKRIKHSVERNMFKYPKPFPVRIDLHLDPGITFTKLTSFNVLLPSLRAYTKHLFQSKKILVFQKRSFPVLPLEDFIIYCMLHFYRHNFQGSHRIELIDGLIRKNNSEIDWKYLGKIINKFGLSNLIYPTLLLLKKYYLTPIPKSLKEEIKPSFFKRAMAHMICKLIFPFNTGTRAEEGAKRYIFILLLSDEGIIKKIKVILNKDTRAYFPLTMISLAKSSLIKLSRSLFAFWLVIL